MFVLIVEKNVKFIPELSGILDLFNSGIKGNKQNLKQEKLSLLMKKGANARHAANFNTRFIRFDNKLKVIVSIIYMLVPLTILLQGAPHQSM